MGLPIIPPAPAMPDWPVVECQSDRRGLFDRLREYFQGRPPELPPSQTTSRFVRSRFSTRIYDAAEAMRVRRIKRVMRESLVRHPDRPFPLPPLGTELLHVTRLFEPIYLPERQVQGILVPPRRRELVALLDRRIEVVRDDSREQKELLSFRHFLQKTLTDEGLSLFDAVDLSREWITLSKKLNSRQLREVDYELKLMGIRAQFAAYLGENPELHPIQEDTTRYVERDELLSRLRRSAPAEVLEQIRRMPLYIPIEDLAELRATYSYEVEGCTPLVCNYDLMHASSLPGNPQHVFNVLMAEQLRDVTSFSFKVGEEGRRESMVREVLTALQLDRFVVRKRWETLPNGADVEGVMGQWVEGRPLAPEWGRYLARRSEYRLIQRLNPDANLAEPTEVIAAEKALSKRGGSRSIQNQLITDLIMGAADAHEDQYLQEDRNFATFDYARCLLPTTVVRSGSDTVALLCSAFLDHPAAEKPLHGELFDLIARWDLDEIAERLAPLVLSREEADEIEGEFTSLISALREAREAVNREAELLDQAEDDPYIAVREGEAAAELRLVRRKVIALQRRMFGSLHPDAFVLLMERMRRVQERVVTQPETTAMELFALLYPDFVPFLEARRELGGVGGQALAVGGCETVLAKAEELSLEDRLLARLRASLERLQASAKPAHLAGWSIIPIIMDPV